MTAFLAGDRSAYMTRILAVLAGAALVTLFFPEQENERELLRQYHAAGMER